MSNTKHESTPDFYCKEVLSGGTAVKKVVETRHALAFHHTRPYWQVHIVVIPKQHIDSLLSLDNGEEGLLLELLTVVRQVAAQVVEEKGGCHIITNLGKYQESKHLHWHVGAGKTIG